MKSIAVTLALSLLCCACRQAPRAQTPGQRPTPVEVARVETRDVEVSLSAVGTAEASQHADIKARVDGVISEVLFREGAQVRAGDILVRLDDRKATARLDLARAALDSARARLAIADQRLERHRELLAGHLVSQEAFDSVEAEQRAAAAAVREQEAAVALAARELEDFSLRAPFAGVVGARLVDVGNYVERGTIVTVLLQTDPMHVRLGIPDRYAGRVRTGMQVRIAPGDRTETVDGTIDFVDPRVDPGTRTLSVRVAVPNPDGTLRDGQFVKATVVIEVHRGQTVAPEQAVVSSEGKTWIYRVAAGRAERREVRTGERLPPMVEILSGVAPGDLVVVAGQHRLRDGIPVEAVREEPQ
ncbi:MAG: efflux RND transporter periplasmic adaptor subunit [Deltaproteobacteria bacterium]|nr:MAG: efflux RND transporter periplasmic adaptor subunit [Deltaproteobacteria bacterium]